MSSTNYFSRLVYHPRTAMLLKFAVSGSGATLINFSLLYVLTQWVGIWYLYSAIIAFITALLVSFTLQKFWTFNDARTHVLSSQITTYTLIQLWNLVCNTTGLYLLVEQVHMWYILAQLILAVGIAIQNFLLYRAFIFTNESTSPVM